MAGELQLGGSTVATHTGSGASAVVTIDNGVAFPAGHIIQVQTAVNSTLVRTSSGSNAYVNSGLSVSITPKFNNSKIIIQHGVGSIVRQQGYYGYRIKRTGPSAIQTLPYIGYSDNSSLKGGFSYYKTFDTPNTLSACTYEVQIYVGSGVDYFWNYDSYGTIEAHLTAMEIKQ